jgi:hypothetical protein
MSKRKAPAPESPAPSAPVSETAATADPAQYARISETGAVTDPAPSARISETGAVPIATAIASALPPGWELVSIGSGATPSAALRVPRTVPPLAVFDLADAALASAGLARSDMRAYADVGGRMVVVSGIRRLPVAPVDAVDPVAPAPQED